MKKKLLRTKTSKRNAKRTGAHSVSLSRWLASTRITWTSSSANAFRKHAESIVKHQIFYKNSPKVHRTRHSLSFVRSLFEIRDQLDKLILDQSRNAE